MFYTQSVEDTLQDLDCSVDGLSTLEAKERSEHYGKNSLPEAKKSTIVDIFIDQFKSPIIYVLLVATIVSFAIKEFTDAQFILAVLFINAFIGLIGGVMALVGVVVITDSKGGGSVFLSGFGMLMFSYIFSTLLDIADSQSRMNARDQIRFDAGVAKENFYESSAPGCSCLLRRWLFAS